MKKFLLLAFIVLCLTAGVMTSFATDVVIDGVKVGFNDSTGYPYVSSEGRTMVPLRVTMEAYGATVRWDDEADTAIVSKGVTTVTCKIGEAAVYSNGTKIKNDAAAVIKGGRTYLPIRAVLESLDAKVSWDGNVQVSSPGAGRLVYDIENSGIKVSNYWKVWEEALALEASGNYSGAVEKFRQVAPVFLQKSDAHSDAMLFKHLGDCYNALGMTDEATACYKRESYYWEIAGLPQAAIDASRRGDLSGSTVQMFVTTKNSKYSARRDFDTLYAPESGVMLGVTMNGSNPSFMSTFKNLSGKDAGGYILYGYYDLKPYKQAFEAAAKEGKVVQYALQVKNLEDLRSITADDSRYIKLAKDIKATGAKTLIRFACEMNDETNDWYTENYSTYIKRFRYVADIFHKYASNCAMVWSPNFYPANNMEFYYPGDKYVDYVGISIYAEHQPETDPLGQGVDRSRFITLLDTIVTLYGHKKPIMISECGASYVDHRTGADLTDYASRQIKDFFRYLPIKYPSVVAAYIFATHDDGGRKFELDKNSAYLDAFKSGIKSSAYLPKSSASYGKYSFEIGNNVTVPAENVSLHAFAKTIDNDISYVKYSVNGTTVGTVYGTPYTLEFDFAPYAGKTVEIMCRAFDSEGAVCAKKTYTIKVK